MNIMSSCPTRKLIVNDKFFSIPSSLFSYNLSSDKKEIRSRRNCEKESITESDHNNQIDYIYA